MNKLRDFQSNNKGFILTTIIVIAFFIMSGIIWLVGLLVINRFYDGLYVIILSAGTRANVTAQAAMTAYSASIVITDICFIIYWALSTQKKESQEYPMGAYY